MKTLLALLATLLIALAALPLREWSELDLQRAPVNRWLWLRSAIVKQPRESIDYAFTGSSKMLSSVHPERIAEGLPGATAYNFAHFAWAHDADYFVARPLLERHDVGTLVIELPLDPPDEPHSDTVHLVSHRELLGELGAAIQELFRPDLLGKGEALKQRISRLSRYTATALFSLPRHVLQRVYAWASGSPWEYQKSLGRWEQHRGFAIPLEYREPAAGFRERQAKRGARLPKRPPRDAAKQLPGPRSEFYLRRLKQIAEEHGTRLVFLHIPSWQKQLPTRAQHRFYSRFGEVVIPDLSQLQVPDYYVDPLHLYREGARVFTDDVARLLENGTQGTTYNDLYRDGSAREARE